jgi:CubicO group peptidase (beta-lactamase class C family)
MIRIRRFAPVLMTLGTLFAQTGIPVPQLQTFDDRIPALMAAWNVPGAALAIAKDGKLVFAHGYGLANVETGDAVQPDSLFRIASISKPFTAAGVMKLVEAGKLDLDAKVYTILRDLMPPRGQLVDERLRDITVRDLLRHTGGWDDHAKDEAMIAAIPFAAADYFGMPPPPSSRMMIRYVYSNIQLDNTPGTSYAYSNFGYMLLGRIVEEVSGMRYQDYIAQEILTPAGIGRMTISGYLPETARPGEVRYYDYPGAPLVPSMFPDGPGMVPAPYFNDSRMEDSFGGWAASAIDLVRFSEAFDGRRGVALLKPETIQAMLARQAAFWPANLWYGFGLVVEPGAAGPTWWHDGQLRGTRSILIHWPNGISVALVFNGCPQQWDNTLNEMIAAINGGLARVRSWPEHDLFPQYDPPAGK